MAEQARTARSLAREAVHASILTAARARLTEEGPAQLSLRAVARDVGLVSSAVYRYFPSRDDLLTALLVAPLAYLSFLSVATATMDVGPRARARLPLVLAIMHMAWGAGFVRGLPNGADDVR